ncbi:ABC-type transport auxiliary lipoprotein family protein [Microvirga arabica]|uniref:ABC-type transport auxiliary lipoprotein family protein n=1 Tax=Microvirga arabica TaxID=1128671 RepID=UPI00193AA91F|nr:ABC-type transport auxiliary lipoprotein family protein [Microvirga arabica]MBM1172209.1 membrane integrity-associated transporter subunit PqiC [Microvirga arabica]
METRARYALIGLFTLGVVLAAFAFAYWLRSAGGFGERAVYRVRFESPVTGLQPGSTVLFNGIPAGVVTELELDRNDPRQVMATIALDQGTPVRADTRVGVEAQGLMGAPSLTLEGGTAASPPLSSGDGTAILVADLAATQDLSQAAREALQRFDRLMAETAEPLRDTISNLSTFSGALARNSDRLDGILEALERLGGGGPAKAPAPTYDLTAPREFPPHDKTMGGQLVIPEPTALVLFDTQKILIRPRAGESVALDAQWSDSLPKLLQAKIIQSFENADYVQTVARPIDGLAADYQLVIDIRSFQVSLTPEPRAEVEFTAKILGGDGRIVGARILQEGVPVRATDAAAAAVGLDEAFGKAATELVLWVSTLI